MKSTKTSKRPTIIMMAHNPISKKFEQVFPEDEVTIDRMVPMFWSRSQNQYFTCPDAAAADYQEEWKAQIR